MAVIPRKFKELVLYFADKSLTDTHYGTVKLNKLLFYSDLRAMQAWGKSITGINYVKDLLGPVPQDIRHTLAEMEAVKEIRIVERPLVREEDGEGFTQRRVVARQDADLSVFDNHEIDLINTVLMDFRGHSGPKVSDISHDFLGWQLAHYDEVIPLTANFIKKRELVPSEISMGQRIAAELAA